MSEAVTIRRGVPGDLEQVIAIAQQSEMAAQWQAADYRAIFVTDRLLLVAERGSRIAGFQVVHNIAGEWELENIAVTREQQRQGIGAALLRALVGAAESNAKFIFLEVRESNEVAKRVYERCGFQQYGRRSAYYSNPTEDAVLYRFLCNPETREKC